MKNKKAEGEFLFVIFIMLVLIFISYTISNSSSYNQYMKDCKKLNYEDKDFKYNTTCSNTTLTEFFQGTYKEVNCQKIDWDDVEIYCQNKYLGEKEE